MNASEQKNQPYRLRTTADRPNAGATLEIPPGKMIPGGGHLPERYTIKQNADERVLISLEAPNLNVHIEAGLSFTGSIARKSPPGTIFLDGVAQCEPFMDHERQVYNLDHHESCVRAFTFSSCEQALVVYMKGLELQGREWHIFANEPDLDTILAIWILLNHARIGTMDKIQRRILFALVRYEGIIDALGLELKELSALPPDLMRKIQRVIDHLRSDEIALKKDGRWEQTDYLNYTAAILHKTDQIFFKASDFEDYQGIEELARINLNDQRIAAVVEADMGIYEIEPHLNRIYGNRLGVVFLKKGIKTYTVRQMDLFMPLSLDEIYQRLNFVDPIVRFRPCVNKWGGAADIGGSPRDSGTGLNPVEIARACYDAFRKPSLLQQAGRFLLTAAVVGFLVLMAYGVKLFWNPIDWFDQLSRSAFWIPPDFGFALALMTTSGILLSLIAYRHPWQYGWISGNGGKWWFLLPAMIASGCAGGIWIPAQTQQYHWFAFVATVIIAMPLAVELLFRSLAHGLLAQRAAIQRDDTRWFISWPAFGSTVLYTGFILAMTFTIQDGTDAPVWRMALTGAGAMVFGLCAAMLRERSHSLFPPMLFHVVTAVTTFLILQVLL